MFTYSLETTRSALFEITDQVRNAVTESGVMSGIAVVFSPHTTAGLSVISRMDELGFIDIEEEMNRLVPTRIDFKHQFDTPTDAAGHVKSMLTGVASVFLVDNGQLVLGSSQGIYFFEFDGPRKRKYHVQVIGAWGGNE